MQLNPFEADAITKENFEERKKIYTALRQENLKIREERKNPIDSDLFGNTGTGSTSARGTGNVNATLKTVKQTYQRLSTLDSSNVTQVLESLRNTNLSRFIDEASSNLIKVRLAHQDIVPFVQVVSFLFQQYPNFLDIFFPAFLAEYDDPQNGLGRRRNFIRAYGDLLLVRCFSNLMEYVRRFRILFSEDAISRKFDNHQFIWGVLTYNGADLIGVDHGANSVLHRMFQDKPAILAKFAPEIKGYYDKICDQMKQLADEGMEARKKAWNSMLTQVIMNAREKAKWDECEAEYEKLHQFASCYAFLMKKTVPEYWKTPELFEITTAFGQIIKVPEEIYKKLKPSDNTAENNNSTDTTAQTNSVESKPKSFQQDSSIFYVLPDVSNLISREVFSLDILHIRSDLDKCISTDQATATHIDNLTSYFLKTFDPEENSKEVVDVFGGISKKNINQGPFYARFIASISAVNPTIGNEIAEKLKTAFIGNICSIVKSTSDKKISTKLHIAKYLAELAKFCVGIEHYFAALEYALRNIRGKTIDMACTLIFIAGKSLEQRSEATSLQMHNAIEILRKNQERYASQPHVSLLISQAVDMFNPQVDEQETTVSIPRLSVYHAFLIHIFRTQITDKNFPTKARKIVERMINDPTTGITIETVIKTVLNLTAFSTPDFRNLALFVRDFSNASSGFGTKLVDILIERIRRGIEVYQPSYHQIQILQMKFLAELVSIQFLDISVAFPILKMILALDTQRLTSLSVTIQQKGSKRNNIKKVQKSDFFRAELVIAFLDSIIPYLKDIFSSVNTLNTAVKFDTIPIVVTPFNQVFLNTNTSEIKINKNSNHYTPLTPNIIQNIQTIMTEIRFIFYYLQYFCLVRAPLPPFITYDMTDLLDKAIGLYNLNFITVYETVNEVKSESSPQFITYSPFVLKTPLSLNIVTKAMKKQTEEESDDSDVEEEDFDDIQIRAFEREFKDWKDECGQEKGSPAITNIAIPVNILDKSTHSDELPKMTAFAPPPDFKINIRKNKKTEVLDLSINNNINNNIIININNDNNINNNNNN